MKLRLFSALLVLALLLSVLCGCVMMASSGDASSLTADDSTAKKTTAHTHDASQAPSTNQGNDDSNGEPSLPEASKLAVHFIDVGQADAILVVCDSKTMLIDGGNVADSNLIYTYLQKNGIKHLDYVVSTHAHEDHVGGLSGALSYATVGTAYSPVLSYSTKAFSSFVKKVEEQGKRLTVPKVGSSFALGAATVSVLGPVKEYEDPNNTSIVLRLVYGEISFLFVGDMERDAETDLILSGVNLSSTVLKVGHHGSSTSSSYRFLREVAPTYGVISVGTDNDYGHPHEEVLSRYRDADVKLYRTDLQGDIIFSSNDGKNLTVQTAKNGNAVTNPTEGEGSGSGSSETEYSYIGNLNSKVYHRNSCLSLPSEINRIYFITKDEAVNAGYRACSRCNP